MTQPFRFQNTPSSTVTFALSTDSVGGSTTLSAPANPGDTNVKVASVTGFVAGQQITIDIGTIAETRTIASVGTSGAGGTGVTLTSAISTYHQSGQPVAAAGPSITTLAAASAAGATNIKVQSVTGFAVGQTVVVGRREPRAHDGRYRRRDRDRPHARIRADERARERRRGRPRRPGRPGRGHEQHVVLGGLGDTRSRRSGQPHAEHREHLLPGPLPGQRPRGDDERRLRRPGHAEPPVAVRRRRHRRRDDPAADVRRRVLRAPDHRHDACQPRPRASASRTRA